MTFTIVTNSDGVRGYRIGYSHSRPTPSSIFAVWAIPQGVAVADINLGGVGTPWNPPPISGCFPVFIASDSHGCFGYQCPSCKGYWRAGGASLMCPYCATQGNRHGFLTDAQQKYVAQYCAMLGRALASIKDGDHVIDMDAVADAVGKNVDKPEFYYAEESQQKRFECNYCGEFNDILGKFCFCSCCGTRNDLFELENSTLPELREHVESGGNYGVNVLQIVSSFDSFVAQYVRQLVRRIPIRSARRAKLEKMRFHNLEAAAIELKSAFDIDLFHGLKVSEIAIAVRLFHRRHVYEHNAGVVDEKYISDSKDNGVRLGQAINETQASVHQLIGITARMAGNLHREFHDIFPPKAEPISRHAERVKREALSKKVVADKKDPNVARQTLRGE